MTKFLTCRGARAAASITALCILAAAPSVADAQVDSDATGTLSAGSLTNTAPAFTPFSITLSGVTQTVTTAVGSWSVNDATGSNAGYTVTVAASAPTVDGVAEDAGTGGSLTLTPRSATAAAGNPAGTGPVASSAQLLSTTAATIQTAAADTGQGRWNFAADSGPTKSLSVVIPGDASAGAYSSTLTYTAAPPVV
jgi:hypothetical protein